MKMRTTTAATTGVTYSGAYRDADAVDALEVDAAVRDELEGLAADLEQHGGGDDDELSEGEQAALEDAAASLSRVAESLETVRGIRGRLRKGKGKGKGKNKPGRRAATSSTSTHEAAVAPRSASRAPGKSAGPRFPSRGGESIAQRKMRSRCKDCGALGHWSGDAECPKVSRARGVQ